MVHPPKPLSNYHKALRLKKHQFPFDCPDCGIKILAKDYEPHCFKQHKVDPLTTCVWCRSESWPKKEKQKHVGHLISCSQKFLILNKTPISREEKDVKPRLLNMEHEVVERQFYGGFDQLPVSDEDFPLLDVVDADIKFQDENLNLAASYVFQYLNASTHDWIHVMVKAVAFESFAQALKADKGITRILSFSCWCSGGERNLENFKVHRHMVVVAPKKHFRKNFWPKVKVAESKPFRNYKCKDSRRIESPMHLVNTLGYLSHLRSQCEFNFNENEDLKYPKNMNHFYIYKSLPKSFALPLSMLWDGGLEEYLYVKKFKNVSPSLLIKSPLTCVNGQYRQRYKDFYRYERGWVVPVSKIFEPTDKETKHYLWLINGKRMHFDNKFKRNESLDDETWLKKQKMGGNLFFDRLENEWWIPRKHDQEYLKTVVPVVEENDRLKTEMGEFKGKIQRLEDENKSQRATIAEMYEKLIIENKLQQKLHEKIEELQSIINVKLEGEIGRLKCENEQLRRENEQLKNEMAKVISENDKLKYEMINLNSENERLKTEMTNLKRKLDESNAENQTLKSKIQRLVEDNRK